MQGSTESQPMPEFSYSAVVPRTALRAGWVVGNQLWVKAIHTYGLCKVLPKSKCVV